MGQSVLKKLKRFTTGHKGEFLASVILSMIGVAFGVLPFLAVAQIAIKLVEGSTDTTYYLCAVAVLLGGYLGKTIFTLLSTRTSHIATYAILKNIRLEMMGKLNRMPMGEIMSMSSGQLKDIIVDRVEGFERTLAHMIPEFTGNFSISFFVLIYLFVIDWRLALCALVPMIVSMFAMPIMMMDYDKQYKTSIETNKRMNNAIVEYVNGIEVIKTFNQGEKSYKKYATAVMDNADFFYKWQKKCQPAMAVSVVLMPATLLTVIPAGIGFYIAGTISLPTFITSMILSLSIVEPIMKASSYMDNLAIVGSVMDQILKILDSKELVRPANSKAIEGNDIVLNNVCFKYNEETEDILKNINLDIKPQSITAIVGPSGSGKSTISKLIAGLWDVNSGEILIGGENIKNISQKELSNKVTYVAQDNYLFNMSVRENIRIGNPNSTDDDIKMVAKSACCDEFIEKLENGYDTIVGDAGSHLSGGERQRIAIARAMLKNSPIVILDEATAYIDTENEAIMQDAIGKLIQNKTVIIVAHRLSTIKDSDKIVVINNGEIVGEGVHDDLLNNCELYKEMWDAHMDAKEA